MQNKYLIFTERKIMSVSAYFNEFQAEIYCTRRIAFNSAQAARWFKQTIKVHSYAHDLCSLKIGINGKTSTVFPRK